MESGLQRSEWYDQTLPAASTETKTPKRKKSRAGLKAVTVVACVLILIVASVYAFSDRGSAEAGKNRGGTWTYPTLPSSAPDDDEEDFRTFFEEFYQSDEESYSGSHLERAAGDSGVKVEIVSAEDRSEISLQELYQGSVESIVGIEAYYDGRVSYAWGTGIVLTGDGYIVTNEHIIDEASRATVVLAGGEEFEAVLIGEDVQTDIAVLKIDAAGLTPAEFGDSAALSVGDRVVAIGNPLGDTLTGTMTDGIISAINRDIQLNGHRMTLLQTNAALNEGNSGGPLFNVYGQVVGITNMKMVNRYSDVTVEGIGFAIPSLTVKAVADQLIAGGEVVGRPGLGITVGPIPETAAERYEIPQGLYITSVSEGSSAKEQGVLPGDILTRVNGREVRKTQDVLTIRDGCAVGDELVLTIWRDGDSFDVTVVLRDLNTLY